MNTAVFQFLQDSFYFQDLTDEDLQELFRFHKQETYRPGQPILRQGTRTDGLYLLIDGEVELTRLVKDEPFHLYNLESACLLGDAELFTAEHRLVSARAKSETTVLFWPRRQLLSFLESRPAALQRLKHAAGSSSLGFKQRFPWLADGEIIHALTRRHPIHLAVGLVFPAVVLIASVLAAFLPAGSETRALVWVSLFLSLTGTGWIAWRIIDYFNDFYILTNQRVVWLEKVIGVYERRRETPLQWVLSSGIGSDIIGRLLHFGDVQIRTYTGQMELTRLPDPQLFIDQLEEQWRLLKQTQNTTDRETMLQTIAERLAEPDRNDEASLTSQPEKNSEAHIGLDQWSFRTRFETEGVISYRKHWAVLLRGLAVPVFLLALSITLAVLQGRNTLPFETDGSLLLYSVIMGMVFLFWCVYRYIDWANEIYQITPTQIVDIHKKPLGQELRKVAPLENILGTEVTQRGIIGLILNYGDVVARVGTSEFAFNEVLNPGAVQQDIVRAQNAFLQRRSRNEKHQRQMEVVEWLSAYHQETRGKDIDGTHQADSVHPDVREIQEEKNHDPASGNHTGSGPAPESPESFPGNG